MRNKWIRWHFIVTVIRLFEPECVHAQDDWGHKYTSIENASSFVGLADWALRKEVNNYVDQFGRYHHKPVTEANPVPSNNGWIYTAYAKKAGLPVDAYKLKLTAEMCNQGDGIYIRTPGKELPPISRDEILGMVALGVMPEKDITEDWNFSPYPIPKFSLINTIKQFWQQKGQHRNYLWQNNLSHTYRFAFSVPLTDRHFILQQYGKFNLFYWAIAKVDSMIGSDSGIRYLKYGKSKTAMQKEFPADHPINNI